MRDAASVMVEKSQRIRPGLFNPRYYHLLQLKRTLQQAIDHHIAPCMAKAILVDYGCGSMPYKEFFAPYLQTYFGADIPENRAADLHIRNGRLVLEPDACDIVLSTQVLEHVADPVLYLQEAHRVLRTNGLLLLSTHGVWRYHPDPTDYWRWTGEGLQKIIRENGFEILGIEGVMGLAATGLQLFQDAFLHKIPIWLRYLFVPFMQLLIVLSDQVHSRQQRRADACVFLVVARKI